MYDFSKIYLIGFMGSGKSTVGRKLASGLNWSFVDLDRVIEQSTGMKIPEIFESKGEGFFRETESALLQSLEPMTRTVISTGGGTPCFGNNMDFMLGSGLTIYLRMTPGQLKSRLIRSSSERPLIRDIGINELEGFIEKKLEEREKCYLRAGITFDRFNDDFNELYEVVKKRIHKEN